MVEVAGVCWTVGSVRVAALPPGRIRIVWPGLATKITVKWKPVPVTEVLNTSDE